MPNRRRMALIGAIGYSITSALIALPWLIAAYLMLERTPPDTILVIGLVVAGLTISGLIGALTGWRTKPDA